MIVTNVIYVAPFCLYEAMFTFILVNLIFALITIFKFLILANYNFEFYFDSSLPKHEFYDFIIGESSDNVRILKIFINFSSE